MVVSYEHADLLCDIRHKGGFQQDSLLLFVIGEGLQQLLVVKVHVLLANVHTCLSEILSSDILEGTNESFE